MLMLSNATYTAWTPERRGLVESDGRIPAARPRLHGGDDHRLASGQPATYGMSLTVIAARACRAGTDMVMLTGSEAANQNNLESLLGLAGSARPRGPRCRPPTTGSSP